MQLWRTLDDEENPTGPLAEYVEKDMYVAFMEELHDQFGDSSMSEPQLAAAIEVRGGCEHRSALLPSPLPVGPSPTSALPPVEGAAQGVSCLLPL